MKLLKQPTDYSCGQTCVAMIANVSPKEVIDIVNEEYKKGKNWAWRGTCARQLVKALKRLGIPSRRKLIKKKEGISLPSLCIVRLTITKERWAHWAVHKNGHILDPYYGKDPNWPKKAHITSYLEIL